MTPLEQVKRIENTINQFKRELECLRLDVRSCEDVLEGFQQALNEIQKEHPELWSEPQGMQYDPEYRYPDELSPVMLLREGEEGGR